MGNTSSTNAHGETYRRLHSIWPLEFNHVHVEKAATLEMLSSAAICLNRLATDEMRSMANTVGDSNLFKGVKALLKL